MKYLGTFKHWSTYFVALWIEIVTTRAQLFFCIRRRDYGCVLGNLMIVAWWIFAVSILRYFYARQKSKQIDPKKAYPSTDAK